MATQWLHSGYTVATQWLHGGYTVATQWLHCDLSTVLFSTLPVDLHCNSCNIGRILQLYSHESCCNIGRILQLLQPRDKCTVLLQPRDKCSHGPALPHAAKNREARRSTCVGGAGARTASRSPGIRRPGYQTWQLQDDARLAFLGDGNWTQRAKSQTAACTVDEAAG